jgi:hypothetical protein
MQGENSVKGKSMTLGIRTIVTRRLKSADDIIRPIILLGEDDGIQKR